MNNYFRLNEEVFLVNDKSGGAAIYNLFDGNIYTIDAKERKLISFLENNFSIDKIIEENQDFSYDYIASKLKLYLEKELGNYYDRPTYIKKLLIDYKSLEHLAWKPAPKISKAFISLSKECYLNCQFCCSNEFVNNSGCIVCSGNEKRFANTNMDINTFNQILESISKMQCGMVILKIPDLGNYVERFKQYFKLVSQYNFDKVFLVVGNGWISKETLRELFHYNIYLILQQNIKHVDDIEKVEQYYKSIIKNNFTTYCTMLYIFGDPKTYNSFYQKYLKLENKMKVICILNHDISGMKKELKPKFIERTNIQNFSLNQAFNNCLYGTIYFNQAGEFFPCPALVDFKLGHIKNLQYLWEELYKFWTLNKNKINKCKECSLRFACNDCRAKEYAIGGDLFNTVSCDR